MGPPGLLYVRTRLTHPDLSHDTFNHWYNDILLPSVLSAARTSSTPGPSVILRYRNVDAAAEAPYLALYPLPDIDWLKSGEWKDVPRSSDVLPAGGHMKDSIEFAIRVYELIQTFEGQDDKPGRGRCIVAAANQPAHGTDEEFDRWYRLQHLDMLSMVPGYCRSTRYRIVEPNDETVVGCEKWDDIPTYLGLHEFDDEHYDRTMLKRPARSEWSKTIVKNYVKFDRDDWVLIHEAGDTSKQIGAF